MDPVVHFEVPAEDKKRMSEFYQNVFGWKTQIFPNNESYVVVTTTEVDKNGRPVTPGGINGGFYEKEKDRPAQYPSVVIAVEDIKKSIEKVKNAGGKILGEPSDIPGIGKYVSFYDTEGNRLSILQPAMNAKNH